MKALLIEGPCDGQLLENLAEPAPHVYTAHKAVGEEPHLSDEPLSASDKTPKVVYEQYCYRLVDEPLMSHKRWISEREIARAEWLTWAFYVHASELESS